MRLHPERITTARRTIPGRRWLARRRLARAAVVALAIASAAHVSAHRLDEYLHASRIDLQPAGLMLELDLTPGAAVAESVIAAIDGNRDGAVSDAEQRDYAQGFVRALKINVDGEPIELHTVSARFPAVEAFRQGEGTIALRATGTHAELQPGPHQLHFRNENTNEKAVYLANALIPSSSRVSVTGQRRDGRQQELTIDYLVHAESMVSATTWLLVLVPAAALLLVGLSRRRRAMAGPR